MNIISILLFIIFSLPGVAGVDVKWNQKEFPEIFYLYSNHGNSFGTLDKNRESEYKSFKIVQDLLKEANTSGLKYVTPVFFRLDLNQGKVVEGGLQLEGKRTTSLEKRTRIRPAGNFLTAEFSGKGTGVGAIFKSLPAKLRELSLTLSSEEAFLSKTSGADKHTDNFLILFPLRKK